MLTTLMYQISFVLRFFVKTWSYERLTYAQKIVFCKLTTATSYANKDAQLKELTFSLPVASMVVAVRQCYSGLADLSLLSTWRICSREQTKTELGTVVTLVHGDFFLRLVFNQSLTRILVYASRRANKVAKWKKGFTNRTNQCSDQIFGSHCAR